MSTYKTLGGKSLSELPQIPTEVTASDDRLTDIIVGWKNNNTNVTGTTNQIQVFQNDVWNDDVEVASSATSGATTGITLNQEYNVRVAVKEGIRVYPSRVVTGEIIEPPYPLSGLIARWQFEDTLTNDEATVTLGGGISYETGLVGKSIKSKQLASPPNYTTEWDVINDVIKNQLSYTISMWFNTTNLSANLDYILRHGNNGARITFRSAGSMEIKNRSGAGAGCSQTYITNAWNHIVMWFDGNGMKIYINNVIGYSDSNNTAWTEDNFLRLSNSNLSLGLIDQTYLYNRALTVAEIAKLYNSGAGI